jgi:hypothetical protein
MYKLVSDDDISGLSLVYKMHRIIVLNFLANHSCTEDLSVQFFYHSPYDVLDASYTKYRVPENEILMLKVGALSTYTTAEARKLSIQQRKCRFPDENNLRISPVYTFNFCQMECRMQIARRKCKCIPHFYRKIGMPFLQQVS